MTPQGCHPPDPAWYKLYRTNNQVALTNKGQGGKGEKKKGDGMAKRPKRAHTVCFHVDKCEKRQKTNNNGDTCWERKDLQEEESRGIWGLRMFALLIWPMVSSCSINMPILEDAAWALP